MAAVAKIPDTERLESWKRAVKRLHEDLTGLEQVEECFTDLFARLHELNASFSRGLFGMVWVQSTAIGIRRLFKKGDARYPNVALQRLLEDLSAHPDVLLRLVAVEPIRTWTGSAAPDERAVREQVDRDLAATTLQVKPVVAYANTIAHLQHVADDKSDELRIRLKALRSALAHLRILVDRYTFVLTDAAPPSLNKDRFVDGFAQEIGRIVNQLTEH